MTDVLTRPEPVSEAASHACQTTCAALTRQAGRIAELEAQCETWRDLALKSKAALEATSAYLAQDK